MDLLNKIKRWYEGWKYRNKWVEEVFDDGSSLWFDARRGCFYYEDAISKNRVEFFAYYNGTETIGHFHFADFNFLEWHSKNWDGRNDLNAKRMTQEEIQDLEKKVMFYAGKWPTRFVVDRSKD